MATFNITASGTTAAQILASAPSALFIGGVFGGAKVRVEVSPDGTNWAGISLSQELRGAGVDAPSVGQFTIPSGWRIRTVTAGATATTSITVVAE